MYLGARVIRTGRTAPAGRSCPFLVYHDDYRFRHRDRRRIYALLKARSGLRLDFYAGAALCLYFFSERAGKNQDLVRVPASSTALLFTLRALWILLPDVVVAPVWAALAVALFTFGLRRDLSHERWQGHLVMIAAILSAWAANFHAAAAIVVFACYLAQFLSPREGAHFSKGWLGYVERYPEGILVAARRCFVDSTALAPISKWPLDNRVGHRRADNFDCGLLLARTQFAPRRTGNTASLHSQAFSIRSS